MKIIIFDKNSYWMKNYKEIIKIRPDVRFGKPCVRDTRISVYDILSCLASGMNREEILNDYPELSLEDIQASLAFAANREKGISVA